MKKLVVFSCTNRPNSNTLKVSKIYENLIRSRGLEVELLDFCLLPHTIAFSETFGNRTEAYKPIIQNFVTEGAKFIFVLPEYNGSFPGVLKVFLESMHPREWENKDACLVGVADGRAGNLRGMEHLTGILQYLKMHVYHNKLPISVINKVIDVNGNFTEEQLRVTNAQIDGFLEF